MKEVIKYLKTLRAISVNLDPTHTSSQCRHLLTDYAGRCEFNMQDLELPEPERKWSFKEVSAAIGGGHSLRQIALSNDTLTGPTFDVTGQEGSEVLDDIVTQIARVAKWEVVDAVFEVIFRPKITNTDEEAEARYLEIERLESLVMQLEVLCVPWF